MTLEASVQRVLRDPRLSSVAFRCGPTRVSAGGYHMIASLVGQRRIRVSTEVVRDRDGARVAGSAFYAARDSTGSARADTFYLRPQIDLGPAERSMAAMVGRALLIHEATHAIQDARAGGAPHRGGMPVVVAETAAYLAQAVYFRLYGQSFREQSLALRERRARSGVTMSDAARDAGDQLLEALEDTAERLVEGGGGDVRGDEYAAIKRAIMRHPVYANRVYAPAGVDGIAAHHAP